MFKLDNQFLITYKDASGLNDSLFIKKSTINFDNENSKVSLTNNFQNFIDRFPTNESATIKIEEVEDDLELFGNVIGTFSYEVMNDNTFRLCQDDFNKQSVRGYISSRDTAMIDYILGYIFEYAFLTQ